jgi:hypothetical protein
MALVGLAVLVGSFMLGLVALAAAVSVGLIAGLVLWLRVAWIRRQLRKQGFGLPGGQGGPDAGHRPAESDVIDAEYTVVSKRRDS